MSSFRNQIFREDKKKEYAQHFDEYLEGKIIDLQPPHGYQMCAKKYFRVNPFLQNFRGRASLGQIANPGINKL